MKTRVQTKTASSEIRCIEHFEDIIFSTKVIPWPHLHVKARPVRATSDNFRKIEWDVAISWQLRGLHSTSRSFSRMSPCAAGTNDFT